MNILASDGFANLLYKIIKMSVVIAQKDFENKCTYFACDGITVTNKSIATGSKSNKIYKVNDIYIGLIGGCDTIQIIEILFHEFFIDKIDIDIKTIYEFIGFLGKNLETRFFIKPDRDGDYNIGGIIVYKDNIYSLSASGKLNISENKDAIGSNVSYFLGVMDSISEYEKDIKSAVKKTMHIITKNIINTGGEINIIKIDW